MNTNKYVILTGANGYLGSYIIRELLHQNYGVVACRYPHYASVIINNEQVLYVEVDITKAATEQYELIRAIKNKKVMGVINAAALLGSSDYDANYKVNAQGVMNMMEFARLHGINRFIQISSVVVQKKIKGPYGVTKLKGQEMLIHSELDYTVFIPAMIMGPESLGLNRVLKNVFRIPFVVPLIGTGKETQHPIYVKDLARAVVDSIEVKAAHNKVYEIAGDRVLTFREFIRLILRYYDKKKVFIFIPPFIARLLGKFFQKVQKVPLFTSEHVKGILQDSNLDTTQISEDLSFKPTPFDQALAESLEAIQTRWDYYLTARNEMVIEMHSNSSNYQ